MPDEVLLELPDVLAHRRVLVRMSPCPPHQVMEIAAELIERAIRRNDLQSMIKRRSALAADSSSDLDRLIVAVPGNPAVTALVKSRIPVGDSESNKILEPLFSGSAPPR